MPEGVGYGPQNTASVGDTLSYIGNHVYGFSGSVSGTDSDINMLNFTTGNHYIRAKIQFSSDAGTSNDLANKIFINGIQVIGQSYTDTRQNTTHNIPFEIIIPPLSEVKTTIKNATSSSPLAGYCSLVGKVYK